MQGKTKMDIARDTCIMLHDNGKECYVVGGGVRDMIMGVPIHDVDIATNAVPGDVSKIFSNAGMRVIPTGIKHGTVTVLVDNEPVEITTYRSESTYSDRRHPDVVTFTGTIEDDLSRRDFTINAMAYDPVTGILKDPHGGQDDIKNKMIRTVGNPDDRFDEDALRMYRDCRFSSKMNFTIDDDTVNSIRRHAHLSVHLSNERIRDELLKTMETRKPSTGLRCMIDNGLLDHVLPEVIAMKGVEQPKKWHDKDVLDHVLDVVDKIPPGNPMLRMAGLFHDIGKPRAFKAGDGTTSFHGHEAIGSAMIPSIGQRLKMPSVDTEYITAMVKHHMIQYEENWKDASVRRLVNNVGIEYIDDLILLNEADYEAKPSTGKTIASQLRDRIARLQSSNLPVTMTTRDLDIHGNDVMNVLGINPGPRVGEVLNYLLDRVIDDPSLNTTSNLVELMKEKFL
jgi:tRNA nucleotidyltransferase/poly(A) polymerase